MSSSYFPHTGYACTTGYSGTTGTTGTTGYANTAIRAAPRPNGYANTAIRAAPRTNGYAHTDPCPNCDDLRHEIACLRSELGLVAGHEARRLLKAAFRTTPHEALMVERLRQAYPRPVRRDTLDRLTTQDYEVGDRNPSYGLTNVYVSRIRKLLGKDAVVTYPLFGYALSPEGFAAVTAALATPQAHTA